MLIRHICGAIQKRVLQLLTHAVVCAPWDEAWVARPPTSPPCLGWEQPLGCCGGDAGPRQCAGSTRCPHRGAGCALPSRGLAGTGLIQQKATVLGSSSRHQGGLPLFLPSSPEGREGSSQRAHGREPATCSALSAPPASPERFALCVAQRAQLVWRRGCRRSPAHPGLIAGSKKRSR